MRTLLLAASFVGIATTGVAASVVCEVNKTDKVTFGEGWAVYEYMGTSGLMEVQQFRCNGALSQGICVHKPDGHPARHLLKRIGGQLIYTVVNTDIDYYSQRSLSSNCTR